MHLVVDLSLSGVSSAWGTEVARMMIRAGDWKPAGFRESTRSYCATDSFEFFNGKESLPFSEVISLEEADAENTVEFRDSATGALVYGIVGAVFFGPVGAALMAIIGSARGAVKVNKVTFIAKFRDGRRLLATTSREAFENAKDVAGL